VYLSQIASAVNFAFAVDTRKKQTILRSQVPGLLDIKRDSNSIDKVIEDAR
jgi:hypothetical protein